MSGIAGISGHAHADLARTVEAMAASMCSRVAEW